MNLIKSLIVALKGFGMGAANVVPGVSGGTIALLTGIYSEIIESLNSLVEPETWKALFKGRFKEFWTRVHGTFLLALAIGVLASILTLARVMEYVIVYHPVQTWAFFFGLIIASSIYMLIDIKKWKFSDVVWTIIGIGLGIAICTLSPTTTPDDWWFIAICGAIAICTMILPGISGSFILVILGKYEYIMSAINDLNWPVLIVFLVGCLVGILAFAKFLHWLLAKCERQTMLVLVGFVIGSLVKVWPWSDMGAVTKAHFLAEGQTLELAQKSTDILMGANIPMEGLVNMHYWEAGLFCLLGIALVWGLESLGKAKK